MQYCKDLRPGENDIFMCGERQRLQLFELTKY